MDDFAQKLAFLEARLTLLERLVAGKSESPSLPEDMLPAGESIKIACDAPGLVISQNYANEHDESNRKFCWIGNDGPIQIVIPVVPIRRFRCCLKLVPHPKVDIRQMRVIANDVAADCEVRHVDELAEINFDVASNGARRINVLLNNLISVRPSDHGENDDQRLLAARFFGAELTVL